jgi:hypothetical protein
MVMRHFDFRQRMLDLELTDGIQLLSALEVKPIPCLNTKITPGSKILITGPVNASNKVLFIETKNIQLLGGEVQTLLITNAFENNLLRIMNMPLKSKPKLDYIEESVSLNPENPERKPLSSQPNPNPKMMEKIVHPKQKDQQIESRTWIDDEDDDLLSIDLNTLTAVKPNYSNDEEILELEKEFINGSQPTSSKFTLPISTIPQKPTICDLAYQYKIKGSSLATIDQYIELTQDEKEMNSFVLFGSSFDFWINLIIDKNDEWLLGCNIIDNYSNNNLKVIVKSDILTKLIGYSATNFQEVYHHNYGNKYIKKNLVDVSIVI